MHEEFAAEIRLLAATRHFLIGRHQKRRLLLELLSVEKGLVLRSAPPVKVCLFTHSRVRVQAGII